MADVLTRAQLAAQIERYERKRDAIRGTSIAAKEQKARIERYLMMLRRRLERAENSDYEEQIVQVKRIE